MVIKHLTVLFYETRNADYHSEEVEVNEKLAYDSLEAYGLQYSTVFLNNQSHVHVFKGSQIRIRTNGCLGFRNSFPSVFLGKKYRFKKYLEIVSLT